MNVYSAIIGSYVPEMSGVFICFFFSFVKKICLYTKDYDLMEISSRKIKDRGRIIDGEKYSSKWGKHVEHSTQGGICLVKEEMNFFLQ